MRLRKMVATYAIAVAIVMSVFPPWKQVNNAHGVEGLADVSEHPASYAFIATPPTPGVNTLPGRLRDIGVGMSIDVTRLVMQYMAVLLTAIGVSLTIELRASSSPAGHGYWQSNPDRAHQPL